MKNTQSGNVLFLILIAVALFAALSYAVTQSTRSGGSNKNETSRINVAVVTQYPVSVQTAVMRMNIGGLDLDDLEFNPPDDFGNCTSPEVCVFHPDGGGATYSAGPPSSIQGGYLEGLDHPYGWFYTSSISVEDLGTSDPELIAFTLVSESECNEINEQVGFEDPGNGPFVFYDTIFAVGSGSGAFYKDNDTPFVGVEALGDGGDGGAFAGHHSGCYIGEGPGNPSYYYYHVLSVR